MEILTSILHGIIIAMAIICLDILFIGMLLCLIVALQNTIKQLKQQQKP